MALQLASEALGSAKSEIFSGGAKTRRRPPLKGGFYSRRSVSTRSARIMQHAESSELRGENANFPAFRAPRKFSAAPCAEFP
jgi:hypothetical protein